MYKCLCIGTFYYFLSASEHNIQLKIVCVKLRGTREYVVVVSIRPIKLMKKKALRKHSLHGKIAVSVLLKPFISGNEKLNGYSIGENAVYEYRI